VRTWCAIYIRAGSPEEISRGERPTCPVCRQLQDDLNDGRSSDHACERTCGGRRRDGNGWRRSALALVSDAEVDVQVATAKRFPRSISRSCVGAGDGDADDRDRRRVHLRDPARRQNDRGAVARFAEVMMHAWGNMRAKGKTLGDDGST
jgi:hypothetical protein